MLSAEAWTALYYAMFHLRKVTRIVNVPGDNGKRCLYCWRTVESRHGNMPQNTRLAVQPIFRMLACLDTI